MKVRLRGILAATVALAALSCGTSPGGPTPVPLPPGGGVTPPDSTNLAPVIRSVQVSTDRTEIDTEVTLTAVVEDAETAVSLLKLEWKADAGTIAGEGLSVRWRAPITTGTPRDYTVTLTVTETYGTAGAGGVRPQHVVSAQSPVMRVHDSPKELGDLSLRFLNDFANSSVSAADAVREFSDACTGKADELRDIANNRVRYQILGSTLRLRRAAVASSNVRADMNVTCGFTSRIKQCEPNERNCAAGDIERVSGDCRLTGVYEQKRWLLCTSNFDPDSTSTIAPAFRSFFGTPR